VDKNQLAAIQKETDLRLIIPFGLTLRLGDVISVGKDATFSLEGTARSVLGQPVGAPRKKGAPVSTYWSSGNDVSCEFRAAGTASMLFPGLPLAEAKIDVTFGGARSWLLAMTGRRLTTLDELNAYRKPILAAYDAGVWKPDWALVTGLAESDRMTLLASEAANTKIGLTLGSELSPAAGLEAKLTAGVSIAAASEQIVQCITDHAAPVACRALRVREHWWSGPTVGSLASLEGADTASDTRFWESMDEGVL